MNAPELMSETPATLFEDAAFNLIKAISPVKNIRKDVVPYEEIKDFISNFIQNKTGELNGVNEEIAKETNEDESSRLSVTSFLQDDTTNQSFNSEILSPTKNAHLLRLPKRERKLVQVRQRRRQAYETKEFFPLECNEPDLLSTFQACYQRLITGNGASAIHCFHVIKNSLTQFFSNNTWAENVQKLVAEFLGRALLKTTDELCAKNERKVNSSPSNVVLEYELMCLVEIFLLSTFPKPLAETNIVAKLRFIYFASSAEHMKKFVDETLCDEFAHILPFYMTGIYEELCMDIPVDLEKYESSEHKLAVDYRFDLLERQSKKRHANIEQLITEDNSSSTSDNEILHSFPRRSSRVSLNGEFEIKKKKNHENGLHTKNNIKVKPEAQRIKPISYLNIPETPEFKMNRKRPRVVLKSTEKEEEDVVQQTPIRKIAKSSRRISERLEKLLKETNQGKKTLRSQVTVKQSHLSMEIAVNVNKRKPHVDLRERFSALSSTTKSERSSIVGSPRKSDRSSIMESPTKKSDLSPNRTIISSVSSNPRKKASMELDDDILKKYRSRMSLIRQNSKRSNTHEVFYGRSNPRSNLFAEEVGSPESASPHNNSTSQKNRSGRSVKQNDDRVYIAHTLLNVHNQRPLSPFKLVVRGDQKFPFKVRKLLRHTTFSKLKRLRNLTRKTQLNLGQQVASV